MDYKVTIEEVAKRAGVSRATAGRVIGNYGSVSEESRQRVEAAAEELKYSPNAMAQGLRSKKTNTIAIVVDRISNKFFSIVIDAIEKEAFRSGYSVIICSTHENLNIELRQLKSLQNRRVDAIIIAPVFSSNPALQRKDFSLYRSDVPMVFIDRPVQGMSFECNLITSDNFGGSYQAAEYLIQQGHRRIAAITTRNFSTELERIEGFKAALRAHKIPVGQECILVPENGDASKGDMLVKEMAMLHEDVTALLVMNIEFLPSVLTGLKDLGMRVPEDISLIVWDESELTNHLGLTTIGQFPEFMGKVAINTAIGLIEDGEKSVTSKTLAAELHIRSSCKKLDI